MKAQSTKQQQKVAPMKPGLVQNASFNQEAPIEAPKTNLNEEINRILQATNPNAPYNLMRYNYQQRYFKTDPNAGATHFHVVRDGAYVFKDENQYNAFDQPTEKLLFNQFNFSTRGTQTFNNPAKVVSIQTIQFDYTTSRGQFSRSIIYDIYKADRKKKYLADAQQQTYQPQNPLEFVANEGQPEANDNESKNDNAQNKTDDNKISGLISLPEAETAKLCQSLSLSEKLIAESTFSDVVTDFAAWNDPADEFKPGEGNLYPLWKFSGNGPVSYIVWHPYYKAIFAVSYGVNQPISTTFSPSVVNIFSLKNPFYPEKIIRVPCYALSVAFNEDNGNYILVGLVDGNVQIYDLSAPEPILIASSSTTTGKHLTAVTCVKWRKDSDKDLGLLQFLSTSSDGYVIAWAFLQGELKTVFKVYFTDNGVANDVGVVYKAKRASISNVYQQNNKSNLQSDATILIAPKPQESESSLSKAAASTPVVGLTSLRLNWEQSWLYAIGTETGLMRICSTDYLTNYIYSFNNKTGGHSMPITGLSWNKFRADLLATSGEDYLVKIWYISRPTPVFTYDLYAPVISCYFSREVSSVLVAATSANTVHVFDFSYRKESEICIYYTVPDDARLTAMSLNDFNSVIAVGDNKGAVRVFKLSPNLRKRSVYVPPKGKTGLVQQLTAQDIAEREMEMEMEKLKEYIAWCERCNAATGID